MSNPYLSVAANARWSAFFGWFQQAGVVDLDATHLKISSGFKMFAVWDVNVPAVVIL